MCAASPSRNARPLAEPIGDPMMHAVGREPVHALDVDAHPLDHALAHIVPRQVLVLVFGLLIAHRADEPRAAFVLQRKDGKKIGRVQARRAARHSSPLRLRRRRRRRRGERRCRRESRSPAPRAPRNARRRSRRCRPLHMSQALHPGVSTRRAHDRCDSSNLSSSVRRSTSTPARER